MLDLRLCFLDGVICPRRVLVLNLLRNVVHSGVQKAGSIPTLPGCSASERPQPLASVHSFLSRHSYQDTLSAICSRQCFNRMLADQSLREQTKSNGTSCEAFHLIEQAQLLLSLCPAPYTHSSMHRRMDAHKKKLDCFLAHVSSSARTAAFAFSTAVSVSAAFAMASFSFCIKAHTAHLSYVR